MMNMERVILMAVFVACLGLTLVKADFEDQIGKGIEDIVKGGVKKATGKSLCDMESVGAGIIACPMPEMSSDRNICCKIAGEPTCCNTIQSKWKIIVGVGAGVVFLLIVACCICCCCCCCRSSPPAPPIIVMQGQTPPQAYPNHPHNRLQEAGGI